MPDKLGQVKQRTEAGLAVIALSDITETTKLSLLKNLLTETLEIIGE